MLHAASNDRLQAKSSLSAVSFKVHHLTHSYSTLHLSATLSIYQSKDQITATGYAGRLIPQFASGNVIEPMEARKSNRNGWDHCPYYLFNAENLGTLLLGSVSDLQILGNYLSIKFFLF